MIATPFPALALLFALGASSAATPASAAEPTFVLSKQGAYTLSVPQGAAVTRASSATDAGVFALVWKGTTYVGLYVGDQPRFPRRKYDPAARMTWLVGTGTSVVSVWAGGKLVGREVLIELPGRARKKSPFFVHAWIPQLPEAELTMADQILMSLGPGEGAR